MSDFVFTAPESAVDALAQRIADAVAARQPQYGSSPWLDVEGAAEYLRTSEHSIRGRSSAGKFRSTNRTAACSSTVASSTSGWAGHEPQLDRPPRRSYNTLVP